MKTSHISLILVSVFLFGCSTTSTKMSGVTKPNSAPLRLRSPDAFDHYQISLEIGLRYHASEFLEGLQPHQSNMAASSIDDIGLNYGKGNMRLSSDTATNGYDPNQAFLKFFADYHTNWVFKANLVFNGSPPPPSRIAISSVNYSGLDCRGRDMSLIDDTGSK
jgi:hypothetical protein